MENRLARKTGRKPINDKCRITSAIQSADLATGGSGLKPTPYKICAPWELCPVSKPSNDEEATASSDLGRIEADDCGGAQAHAGDLDGGVQSGDQGWQQHERRSGWKTGKCLDEPYNRVLGLCSGLYAAAEVWRAR